MCIIYGLYNPNTKQLKYIGQTIHSIEHRLSRHYREAKTNKNNKKCNWIRKMLRLYNIVDIQVLQENAEWNVDEITWIEQAKLMGCNLVNGTNGEEGTLGLSPNDKTRQKMSLSAQKRYSNNKHPWIGRKHNKESLIKMSKVKIGKKLTEEHKKQISQGGKGKKKSICFCEKISKKQQKPILCITDNKIYDSIIAASKDLNIDNSRIG